MCAPAYSGRSATPALSLTHSLTPLTHSLTHSLSHVTHHARVRERVLVCSCACGEHQGKRAHVTYREEEEEEEEDLFVFNDTIEGPRKVPGEGLDKSARKMQIGYQTVVIFGRRRLQTHCEAQGHF
jgi:hypothetical protein